MLLSLPPISLGLVDVLMRTAFNDDFKRQQNSALLHYVGLVKSAGGEPVYIFGNWINQQL